MLPGLVFSKQTMGKQAITIIEDLTYTQIRHDLATPVTTARLNLDMLLSRKTQPEVKKYARRALSGLRQIDLIMARLPRKEEFAVKPEIMDTVALLRPDLKQHKITLFLELEDGVIIRGNRAAFASIIRNLVSNAISALSRVATQRLLAVTLGSGRGRLIIKICDNAGGIPPQIKTVLFRQPVTTKSDGHGLGLLLVKQQVEHEFNGKIICLSKIGVGTTFTITLPHGS
jgi:signal transduction histidine kinase